MKTVRTAAAVAMAAGLATAAMGQADAPLSWNNSGGGTASISSNWSPAAVPAGADDLTFNVVSLGGYTITYNVLTPASRTHVYKQSHVTLVASSTHTVSNGITVGETSPDSATLTVTTGTLASQGNVVLGNASGTLGTLNVNDDDADLVTLGTADLTVGNGGDAALSITGGGGVSVADQFIAGANSTSSPTVTVSGALNVSPFTRSTLVVNGASQSRIGAGGDATMNVANGAIAQFVGELVVANGSASASSITVGGISLINRATLDVGTNLLVGRNTTVVAAGTGTVTVNSGGSVFAGGSITLGDPEGGTGTLVVNTNGEVETGSLNIGAGGALSMAGGTLDVLGGTLSYTNAAASFVIGGAGGPVVTMRNNASATLSTVVASRALTVGGGSGAMQADFDLRTGADLTVPAGLVVIGEGTDDAGSMIVNGSGSSFTMGPDTTVVVGQSGSGHLEAELSGTFSLDTATIGQNPGSEGLLLIEGAGSTGSFRRITVGGALGSAGGSGIFSVVQDAVVTVSGPASLVNVWPGGTLSIVNADLNAAAPVDIRGTLNIEGTSELHATNLTVLAGGEIRAHPVVPGPAVIDAPTTMQNATSLTLTNGDLTIGLATSAAGFAGQTGSDIAVGDNHLTLLDQDEAVVYAVTIAGGEITAANGINILNNGSIDGEGTIHGDVFFSSGGSVLTATGTGLTINGMLRNLSGNIDGTRFTFATPGGGWTGAGECNARAVFNAGTTAFAEANMTMGLNVFDGVTMNGTLRCNNRIVTLVDSNGVGLGTLTDLDGGELICAQNLTVNAGRTFQGSGFVTTPTLSLLGIVKPGDSVDEGQRVGTLNVSGAAVLGAANDYFCDIFPGIEFPTADRITATGPITVDGDLIVSFIQGYTGQANNTFDIAIGSTRTGEFDSITSPPTPFGPAHVVYLPNRARLIMCYANCDGSVVNPTLNVQDFSCFLNRFAAGESYANCDQSTATPTLNVQDFACFLNKFASGCQ